jgi:hypothetical protein
MAFFKTTWYILTRIFRFLLTLTVGAIAGFVAGASFMVKREIDVKTKASPQAPEAPPVPSER